MATDIGKLVEKELETVFRALKESHLLGWHRLPDTHSAGGQLIGEQPSDYLVALPPGSHSPLNDQRLLFVELKASEKYTSFNKSMMQPAQRGAVNLYRLVLQLPYLILFYSAKSGTLQVWDGEVAVSETRIDKLSPIIAFENVGEGARLNEQAFSKALSDLFQLPPKSKTLAAYACL